MAQEVEVSSARCSCRPLRAGLWRAPPPSAIRGWWDPDSSEGRTQGLGANYVDSGAAPSRRAVQLGTYMLNMKMLKLRP